MAIDYFDAPELGWKLLSYMALDADSQLSLIGPAKKWFGEETPEINPGANYLLGIAHAFPAYRNILIDEAGLESVSAIFELDALLKLMLSDCGSYWWTTKEVRENAVWRLVRRLARLTLAEAGLAINPPDEPFWHESLFEVDGYLLRPLPPS